MKRSYFFLVSVSVVATMVLSVISFISFQDLVLTLEEAQQLRTQKFDFISLLSDLKDAETGQRGFLITGQDSYLEPYYDALKSIEEDIAKLKKEVPSSKKQLLLFQELLTLIQAKLSELSRTIDHRRQENFEAAQKIVSSYEGKRIMDHIRMIIDQLMLNQNQEVEKNHDLVQSLIDQSLWLNVLVLFVSNALICLFSFLFYRDSVKLSSIKLQFRETYDLYKAILDSAKQMIITTDTQGIVTSFNKGAEKLLGYKTDEVTNKASILDFYDREQLKNKATEWEEKKHLQYDEFEVLVASSRFLIWIDSEWTMKKKNEHAFKCSQSITALRNELNMITGYLFIGTDVTSHQKWEEELQEAKKAIAIAQLSKNHFLASLNHELKTPLSAIMNFSNLLSNHVGGDLTDLEMNYIRRIKSTCQGALDTINEILTISRQEGQSLQLEITKVSLSSVIQQILDEIKEWQNVKFVVNISKHTQPLQTDPKHFYALIKHLIRDIVSRAHNSVTIQVKTHPQTFEPIELCIGSHEKNTPVKDKAIFRGLEEESVDFAIAQSIANQMGYQLKANRKEAKERLYTLLLRPLQPTMHLSDNPLASLYTDEIKFPKLSNEKDFHLTILILDEDINSRALLTTYLEELGCRVISAIAEVEFLSLAKMHAVDLMMMDLRMASATDYEVINQLQNDPDLKPIPYVVVSEMAKEMKSNVPGALAFIDKPITREELMRVLQLYQNRHATRERTAFP